MAALRSIALLTLIGACSCKPPSCSYWKLWEHLDLPSNSYVANVRPVEDWKKFTEVSIDMTVYGILKVDEKSQTVKGAFWVTVGWKNEFLRWKPTDFCGIDTITVPRSMVWIPDLHIEEDVSDTSSIQNSPFVSLHANGIAIANFRQLMTFTCQLDIGLFPFDDQTCAVTFRSTSSDAPPPFRVTMPLRANSINNFRGHDISWSAVMTLTTMSNGTQLTNSSKNVILTQGEWELLNITVTEGVALNPSNQTYSKLTYNVMVSRRPMLYVINFIVPLMYFLILDLGSFFINEARGEKLNFKVTILLSISVLLLILKDMLPSTENTLPWIASYSVGIFALVGISVLEAMTVGFLLSFEEKVKDEPQTGLNCEEDFQLERNNSKGDPVVLLAVSGELTKVSPPPASTTIEVEILRQILSEIKTTREELGRAKVPKTRLRFKKIALIIDVGFFVLYFLAVLIFMSVVYDQWVKKYIMRI